MFRSKWEIVFIILLLMIFAAGLGLALYPHIQGAIVDHHIAQEAEEFLDWLSGEDTDPEPDILVIPGTTEETQPRPYSDLWEEMQAYNERIHTNGQAGLTTSASYQVPSFKLTDYGLADEKFGVIQIPKLDLEMPLLLGANDVTMADGAAVLSETSIPIGGSNTNTVIAGHRGYGGASYFRYIPDLTVGDTVIITNLWETLTYKVVEEKIIDPHEVDEILIVPGKDMVTLLTCHPYASGGRQRYLVYCERVTETEETEVYHD